MAINPSGIGRDVLNSGVVGDRGDDNWGANYVFKAGGLQNDITMIGNSSDVTASGYMSQRWIDQADGNRYDVTMVSGALTITVVV